MKKTTTLRTRLSRTRAELNHCRQCHHFHPCLQKQARANLCHDKKVYWWILSPEIASLILVLCGENICVICSSFNMYHDFSAIYQNYVTSPSMHIMMCFSESSVIPRLYYKLERCTKMTLS